jgi:hypothetical protein
MMTREDWRDGISAGLLGALGVALWFFLLDVIDGTPLATPEILGRGTFRLLGRDAELSPMGHIVGYSIVHVAVFIGIGVLVNRIVVVSRRTPAVLAGLLLLFVVLQTGFQLLPVLFAETPEWSSLSWVRIGFANLFASFLMGVYIWRREPGIGLRFAKVLDGRT